LPPPLPLSGEDPVIRLSLAGGTSREKIVPHGLTVGAVAASCLLVGWSSQPTTPDACQVLSLKDALAVIGPPLDLKPHESNAIFSTCVYSRPNQDPLAISEHVEIHYWLLADAAAAKDKYQRVVHPGPMAGTTVTPVSNLGDEADIKRTPSSKVNSIEFRRGVAIVTIGVSPLVSDSALKVAANTAVTHVADNAGKPQRAGTAKGGQ
jgi:hypothetical protein